MGGINKAIICGRLGKDPEVKELGRDKDRKVCNLSIATSKKIKGEEKTEWHRVTVWSENSIKYLEDYAVKGSLVYIEGEIETRSYEKDGSTRYATEIVVGQFGGAVQILTDFKEKEDRGGAKPRERKQTYEQASKGEEYDPELSDEIPF